MRSLANLEKQTKKSASKKLLVSYDAFAIFRASVEHMEILCEAKNKTDITLKK